MGTGSFGSGGGGTARGGSGGTARGGSGGGGGGGGAAPGGGIRFSAHGAAIIDIDLQGAEAEVSRILQNLPKEYVTLQFANPFLDAVYNEIFFLKTDLLQNRDWHGVEQRLGVPGGMGCMPAWVKAVVERNEVMDFKQRNKVVETVQMALEDFLITAMNDDPTLYFNADSTRAIRAIEANRNYFNTISGIFLGQLIWRIAEREREALPPSVELRLQEACTNKANTIITAFEQKFRHQRVGDIDMVTHQNLFHVFAQETTWLIQNF